MFPTVSRKPTGRTYHSPHGIRLVLTGASGVPAPRPRRGAPGPGRAAARDALAAGGGALPRRLGPARRPAAGRRDARRIGGPPAGLEGRGAPARPPRAAGDPQ